MDKTFALCTFVILAYASGAQAAVTVDYRNHDSVERIFEAICSGSRTSITFEGGTTGAATMQGSAPCKIRSGDQDVELRGGEDVEIRDGVLRIK